MGSPGRISGILDFGGREYCVNTPPFIETTYKLLLCLCGGSGSGPTFRTQLAIGSTFGDSVICVYPTPTLNEYGFTSWNPADDQPFNPTAHDVEYLTDLVDNMIDTNRVNIDDMWICGHSEGGMMGYRLICEQPDRWRGLYSISGALLVNNPDTFTGKLRETHGTDDMNVPINGGYGPDGFFHVDYPSAYDVVPSFTKVQNPGIGNLNPLVGAAHDIPSIRTGLIAQGTTLQQDINNFIYN
jgi:poly(3-hydroxybutyrate) depolymerase